MSPTTSSPTCWRPAGSKKPSPPREEEAPTAPPPESGRQLTASATRFAASIAAWPDSSLDDLADLGPDELGGEFAGFVIRGRSFIGPFETADLNTRGGIESHAAKMGPAYARMGAERGQHDPWTPDLIAEVTAQRRALLDLDDWDERVRWRDRQLIRMHAPNAV